MTQAAPFCYVLCMLRLSYLLFELFSTSFLALKEKVADRLIATAEHVIPGLSKRIEVKFSGTPHAFERYTLNSGGASAGWTFHPQKAMNSGLKFLTAFNPPVKNLYQLGHWAMSPGGVPSGAITGRIVSEIVRRRLEWGL